MEWKDKLRVMNGISKGFRQSKLHMDCKEKAVHPTLKGVQGGKRYICAKCKKVYIAYSVQVDHIEPVIPFNWAKRDIPIEHFIKRVYCDPSNLQVLCKPCHLDKTNRS